MATVNGKAIKHPVHTAVWSIITLSSVRLDMLQLAGSEGTSVFSFLSSLHPVVFIVAGLIDSLPSSVDAFSYSASVTELVTVLLVIAGPAGVG